MENTVQPDWSRMTIWRMRTECWITKATDFDVLLTVHLSIFSLVIKPTSCTKFVLQ